MISTPELLYCLFAFLTAAAAAFLITPLAKRLAVKLGAVDHPEARRVNKKVMPRMGGLAIYLGFVLAVLIFAELDKVFVGILLGSVVIVSLGAVDDVLGLKAWIKFIFQLIAAAIPVLFGLKIDFLSNIFKVGGEHYIQLGFWSVPLTIIWIAAISNAVNFIDGLDGLACGVSTISSLSIFIILVQLGDPAMALVMAALAGACIGFLPYNFNPAKIFMGDSGALFLGYILATVSINGMFKWYTVVSFAVPFLVLGMPIIELTTSSIRRICHGKSPFSADRKHIHHRLLDLGMSQKQAVAILYTISGVLGLSAVILTTSGKIRLIVFAAAIMLALAWSVWLYVYEAGKHRKKKQLLNNKAVCSKEGKEE